VYTIRMGSDVAEAQIDDLSGAEIDVLLETYEVLRLTPDNGRKLGHVDSAAAIAGRR
jgi:hypothetical protein